MSTLLSQQQLVKDEILLQWLNDKLSKMRRYVEDLYTDLRDGQCLILLLELLSGEQLCRKRSRLRIHMLQNMRTVFDFLGSRDEDGVSAIQVEDIVDGHRSSTLILVTMIMKQFQTAHHIVERRNKQSTQEVPMKSIWEERMVSLIPLKLPYENIDKSDADSEWKTSPWLQPLLDSGVGDAKRMLLDAFAIYCARISCDTELHIGWIMKRTDIQHHNREHGHLVVPMIVKLSLGDSWGAVSETIDTELATLALNFKVPFNPRLHRKSDQMLPFVKESWRIFVSATNGALPDIEELIGCERVLILQTNEIGSFRWIYNTAILNTDVVKRMSKHLRELVRDFLRSTHDETPICELNMLPEEEKVLLLKENNFFEHKTSDQICIHQLFERQVVLAPNSTALIYREKYVTYAELNATANRLAHRLIRQGVRPESVVAICVRMPPTRVVSILAVLKAGGACLPLDTAYTGSHLIDSIIDVAPHVLIADERGRRALIDVDFSTMTVIDPEEWHSDVDTDPKVTDLNIRSLAYTLYTSGTTGKPKGVMVEHQHITNTFEAMKTWGQFTSDDVWFHLHSVAFAYALLEFWKPLHSGGKLVLLSPEDTQSVDIKHQLIIKHCVTVLTQTLTAFKSLIARPGGTAICKNLRYVIFSGEPLNLVNLKPLFDEQISILPTFVNLYGTSETLFALGKVLHRRDIERNEYTIGIPLKNVTVYLLDTNEQLVPLGAVGELYIRSSSVTRGYFNMPELTATRFMVDPFAETGGERIYRTGDLAKYSADGSVMLIGRNDQQIKIRGFRIEAGSIEAHLKDHHAVRDALVVATGEELDKRLIAYVVAEALNELPQRLYGHLAVRLPPYMIPMAFVRVEKCPCSPNGKLSTRLLPPVDEISLVRGSYEEPQGEVEVRLAHIWEKVLHVDRVGRQDSFFALGGNSLLAVTVVEDMRSDELSLGISNLYKHPVLSDLARTVRQNVSFTVPMNRITPRCMMITPEMLPLIDITQSDIDRIIATVPGGLPNVQDIYALSPSQDGILYHHLLSAKGDPYLIRKMLAFSSYDDLNHHLRAFQKVIDRHDILRTCFLSEGLFEPVQVVCRHAILPITELTLGTDEISIQEKLGIFYGPEQYRIDLGVPPLMQMVIARETDGHWILMSLIHHMIYDERTSRAIEAEILLYVSDREELLEGPIPFRNYIARIRQYPSTVDHAIFFTGMLSDIDEPTLPFGLEVKNNNHKKISKQYAGLELKLTQQLRVYAKSFGVNLATLCHLAWAVVVSRSSGLDRVVFGTVLLSGIGNARGSASEIGLYVNTLPIRLNIDETPVRESLRRTQATLGWLMECEHMSLASVQRYSTVSFGTALFGSLFNYRHHPSSDLRTDVISYRILQEESQTHYPIVLSIDDNDVELTLEVDVLEQVQPTRVCDYMRVALENIFAALDTSAERKICSIDIIPDAESTLLLESWNQIQKSGYDPICLHRVFEEQVAHRPSSTAIIFENAAITYSELNRRANRVAHHLIEIGVKPETCVGILMSVSPAMLIGLLAVLKAGGAYVPLDPFHPKQRLLEIINDASLKYLITDDHEIFKFGTISECPTVVIYADQTFSQPNTNPVVENLVPENLAYVIYTSGSTGRPKGVMIEHRNIVGLFDATKSLFGFNEYDTWCLFHVLAFDASVWEIWGALFHGGKLVVMSRDDALSPEATYDLLCKQNVTVLNQTQSAFKVRIDMFLDRGVPNRLRYIIFGGESLNPRILQPLYAKYGDTLPRFVNMFGITETTVHSTHKVLEQQDVSQSSSLIGIQLPHSRLYLLNAHRQLVPLGAVGEIYISGAGVARGYLNRPELTSERFLPNPFDDHISEQMYRTGDLARYLPDGTLVFMGRSDHQVKVRGFRIETGEIEARLREHPAVRDAVVIAVGENTEKRLVAYVVADTQENLPAMLRAHVSSLLPDYMVPAAIVRLDEVPITRNGKVDLRALPPPNDDALAQQTYEAPRGEIEITLAQIWSELLDIERVSRCDSFVALGGHSLHAVRIIERMRCFGYRLAIHDLFIFPKLWEMAQTVKQDISVLVPPNTITQGVIKLTPQMLPLIEFDQADIDEIMLQVPDGISNVQDIYALSPLQEGILLHHLLSTNKDPYLLTFLYEFNDHLILNRYMEAVQKIIDRHDILRTAFFWERLSRPAQLVSRKATLSITELTLSPNEGPVTEQLIHRYDPRSLRIDLSRAPLIKFVIARDSNGNWVLLQLLHHIIGDHSMLKLMHAEVRAFMDDENPFLEAPVPYRNHIANIRSSVDHDRHREFFSRMLSDVQNSSLAFDLAGVYQDGSHIRESYKYLNPDLINEIRMRAKQMNVSLASLCHLAWALVMSRINGLERVVFGTVLFGRMSAVGKSDTAMGLFVNTLPIRVLIDDSPLVDCAHQVHNTIAQLLEHKHASLPLIQRCSGMTSTVPLFNTLLNYRHNFTSVELDEISRGVRLIGAFGCTNYPVTLSIDDDDLSLTLNSQTAAPIDSHRVCSYTQQALESLTSSLGFAERVLVRTIEVVPEKENQQLLETFNSGRLSHPGMACIHQLFEQQAFRTPTAVALVFEDEIITYAELNARANHLAHNLMDLNDVEETYVGICVSVSSAMIVALLAVLKAGSAYVPLDAAYPKHRLVTIIDDASVNIVIADSISAGKLDTLPIIIIDPDVPSSQPNTDPFIPELNGENLAYVIYTSGSTGKPKGVIGKHSNIVRLFDASESWFDFNDNDVWCLFHSISFDLSMWEIWGALRYGGQLLLMSRDEVRSSEATHRLICQHRVTVLNQTPSAFRASIDKFTVLPIKDHLRCIMFIGESLDPNILRPMYVTRGDHVPRFVNLYGPTETTVYTTIYDMNKTDISRSYTFIGKHLIDTKIYLLDTHRQPVPFGVVGELYVSGAGVTCGYLNRPDLMSKQFLPDPFDDSVGSMMYKTGDLARYSPDANLVFIGRNDQQVKVRGFRIEVGEIEHQLRCHPAVKNAAVVAWGDEANKRLVAYIECEDVANFAQAMHQHLTIRLPEQMMPSAFLQIEQLPLTANGKLDQGALPSVDETSFVRGYFEAPESEVEIALASVWVGLLGLEQVGRHDSFFRLGGHSLLAMRVIEAMRSRGFAVTIRDIFQYPVLSDLAETVQGHRPIVVPANMLTSESDQLTPEMLPLIDLTQSDIDHIISNVPEGLSNIQDIYDLSPIQHGILFHHLLSNNSDSYLTTKLFSFENYQQLNRYITAFQSVLNKHDILRTSVFWQRTSVPAQVVWRHVKLPVIELTLDTNDGSVDDQLCARYGPLRSRIDLEKAPLIRCVIARDVGRWLLLSMVHHIIFDETTGRAIDSEILECLDDRRIDTCSLTPFRNHIAQVRRDLQKESHIRFFTDMLGDIEEPTLPFGLFGVHDTNTQLSDSNISLDTKTVHRLRSQAKSFNVSLATLCHLAWGLIVSRSSGQTQSVFGTVLFGRMLSGEASDPGVGVFINTLPLRVDIDDSPIFVAVHRTQELLAQLLEHEHASLASAQRCSHIAHAMPLFSSLLNYRHGIPTKVLKMSKAPFQLLRIEGQTNYPLVVKFNDNDNRLDLDVQVSEPVVPSRICAYTQETLKNLADALEYSPEKRICSIEILPEGERTMLLQTWNRTDTSKPDTPCLHQFFERHVTRQPFNRAVVHNHENISYAELNCQANRVAHKLMEVGVVPDSFVGISTSVSIGMLVGILAVLKAGGAYIPLDPLYSKHRLVDIMDDASLMIVIADQTGIDKLGLADLSVTIIDPNIQPLQPEINPVVLDLTSHNLAYVIYTSGSTGRPKGVTVEHRNVVSLFEATEQLFNFHEQDVWCLFHSIAFDFSVWEIWGALRYGGQLVLMSPETIRSPKATVDLICEHHVTVLNQTPSAFRSSVDEFSKKSVQHHLRYVIFGGESLDPRIVHPLMKKHGGTSSKFVNMFGITETTIHVTHKILTELDTVQSRSLIGNQLPDSRIYLLDAHGSPVPLGAVGEVYVGGSSVTRGYLNRPDLTSERFLLDPFNDTTGARMYKTGDIARYLSDENLVFMGRNDQQVKIRGYRIETGDVESCLRSHHKVRDAFVVVVGENAAKCLVAYVEADAQENLAAILRSFTMKQLPSFMIPSAIVRLDTIPLTRNGKVDLQALPPLDNTALAQNAYEAPRSEVECALAVVWQKVLNIGRVSRQDSFFALGGHSLTAMQLIEHMRCLGFQISINDVFLHPILCELAQTAGDDQSVSVPENVIAPGITVITPDMLPLIDLTQEDIDRLLSEIPGGIDNVQDIYALSPLQEGIIFHHLLASEGDPYLMLFHLTFTERVILERYISAFEKVIDRLDILRTAFFWEGLSTRAQVVFRTASLSVVELSLPPEQGSVFEHLRHRHDQSSHRISLQQPPLWKFVIARESDGTWVMIQLVHHLIISRMIHDLIDRELLAHLCGRGDTLDSPAPFRNLIANARFRVDPKAHSEFFSNMLSDVDEPTLAFGLTEVYHDGSKIGESQYFVPGILQNELRKQARKSNVSPASFYHLAWALVLSRTSGQRNVVFGTVLFGQIRSDGGSHNDMGLFVNTLPVKVNIDETPVRDCLQRTHNTLAELFEHEHASLAVAQRFSNVKNKSTLFNALLNYRHNLDLVRVREIADGITFHGVLERTNYPLAVSVDDDGSSLAVTCQSVEPIDPERICTYMHQASESLVDSLGSLQQVPICSIDTLPQTEYKSITETWNSGSNLQRDQLCVHQLFEKQVAQMQTTIALMQGKTVLTYSELNAGANRLAHRLIELGVFPGSPIGICVSISPAMVIGILAIMKAGGIYVPLDSEYPERRLMDVIEDASLKIVIADQVGFNKLKTETLDVIFVDPNTPFPQQDVNPIVPDLNSENPVYIIYTSGSTGRPKGVIVQHRNVVTLFEAAESWFGFNQHDIWGLFHSMAFDFSVWEMWGALRHGGKLVLPSRNALRDPEATYQFIVENHVTVLSQTPSAFKARSAPFIKNPSQDQLRYIIIGGEAVDPRIFYPLYVARKRNPLRFIHVYGTTETTVLTTVQELKEEDMLKSYCTLGRCITETNMYLLDTDNRPVPFGVVGELYIGGAGVTCGYLNRPNQTSTRFVIDPFIDSIGAKMYRTGDLAKYVSNRDLIFVGRNDQQVKVRGFRIETGEIEQCLRSHPTVSDALVRVVGNELNQRLVAYIVCVSVENPITALQHHLTMHLPEHMIPSNFVQIDRIPLNSNGKIDSGVLCLEDESLIIPECYEAPQNEIEVRLAEIWQNLLGLDRVGRHDSFFALGGHSLLAMQLIETMRAEGLKMEIRHLFQYPVLSELAKTVKKHDSVAVPPNVLSLTSRRLTPELLPLIDLTQTDIDRIVSGIPGGLSNIQDIYDVSPLQHGILFHHLLSTDGDPYLTMRMLAFADREQLHRYLEALQAVVDRHDIMRTSIFWEGISVPAQVVWRHALVSITEVTFGVETNSVSEELYHRYALRRFRMDLNQAPLIRCITARESDGHWILLSFIHHLIFDEITATAITTEILAFLSGNESSLAPPIPFRNHIAQVRQGLTEEEHVRFFTQMLFGVHEPSLPFGLMGVHAENTSFGAAEMVFDTEFLKMLRAEVKIAEVSLASICHLAWALIVSRTSSVMRVVFGTVLFGRMQAGSGSNVGLGMFINTLPIRLDIDETPVCHSLRTTQQRLAQVLEHEHASLATAQRCSQLALGAPLFSSLLNYRHRSSVRDNTNNAVPFEVLRNEGQTNYPLVLSIDEDDAKLALEVQVLKQVEPSQICNFMQEALKNLVIAINKSPEIPLYSIDVIPSADCALLCERWKGTTKSEYNPTCLHYLFEQRVSQNPSATALVDRNETLTYSELNIRANRLAHCLIQLGVVPGSLVGLCVSVSPSMVVGVLAILKTGGAYVPLDPNHPKQRLIDIMTDAELDIVVADQIGSDKLESAPAIFVDPNAHLSKLSTNPIIRELSSRNLVYVIYTSGSTGKPKGVMVEHCNVVRLFDGTDSCFGFKQADVWCVFHSIAFDVSVWEIWGALCSGGHSILMSRETVRSPDATYDLICKHRVTVLIQTPSAFSTRVHRFIQKPIQDHLRYIIFGGESLDPRILEPLFSARVKFLPRFINVYGPTETTVYTTFKELHEQDLLKSTSSIGVNLPDTSIYLLDARGRPVPTGVVGEIYVGGAGVAHGYLNRPQLTAERFLKDAFTDCLNARMFKTGDLARYLPNGDLVFSGRIDDQVKIRGFRVEPREIEACLMTCPGIKQAAVLYFENASQNYLVAYVVVEARNDIAQYLRKHLTSMLPHYMIPSKFVRLDSLPMTSNFKLDRQALPAPEKEDIACRVYETPISNTEWMLTAIWGQLLGIDRVGRNDDFFALGGHSLIALQMINLAVDRGMICSLNDIFQYPVLADLASKINADTTTQRERSAIAVRSSEIEPPLFFVPTGQGDFSHVYSLSAYIRPSLPIYVLPWPAFQDEQISSMEELATGMLRPMKIVQEKGPYRICGYSSGGILSYAIASALEEANESVSFVGLIDTMIPVSTDEHMKLERKFLIASLIAVAGSERQNDITRLSEKMNEMSIIEFVEAAKQLQLYPPNLHSRHYAEQLDQSINYHKLANAYNFRDLRVPVHQFNAIHCSSSVDSINAEFGYLFRNESTDWAERLPRTIFKITSIPGDHMSMFENPGNRKVLGKTICDAIPR